MPCSAKQQKACTPFISVRRKLDSPHQDAMAADSMNVLATLLVVGTMDKARGSIVEGGNIKQSYVEKLSQVSQCLLPCLLHVYRM